jgi:hypothetical protein
MGKIFAFVLVVRATPTVSHFLIPISWCLATPKIIWGGKKTAHL